MKSFILLSSHADFEEKLEELRNEFPESRVERLSPFDKQRLSSIAINQRRDMAQRNIILAIPDLLYEEEQIELAKVLEFSRRLNISALICGNVRYMTPRLRVNVDNLTS